MRASSAVCPSAIFVRRSRAPRAWSSCAASLGAFESQMVLEGETIAKHAVGEEGAEGIGAFLEKRTPRFPGRGTR